MGSRRVPAFFVSHGAPRFTLAPRDATNRWLREHGAEVRRLCPAAVVVISAHHEATPVRVTSSPAPPTIHDHPAVDHHGVSYRAPGSPAIAQRVSALLGAAGIACTADPDRGFDHGAWIPLSLLLPEQDVPVVQLSLDAGGSPAAHVAIGRALRPLRDEGVLLLGSGGVTHNQDEFRRSYFARDDPLEPTGWSRAFDAWVAAVMTGSTGDARLAALQRFREHPLAPFAHPTPEHFLPLLVIAGAGGDGPATRVFEGYQHSLSTSAFRIDP